MLRLLFLGFSFTFLMAQIKQEMQNFDSLRLGNVFTKTVFTQNILGVNEWKIGTHTTSKTGNYAKISAYKSETLEEDLLFLKFDLKNYYQAKIQFKSALGYFSGNCLQVYVTTTKTHPLEKELKDAIIITDKNLTNNKFTDFIPSGWIDITAYAGGDMYLVFRYLGDVKKCSTLYEIDDVEIMGE